MLYDFFDDIVCINLESRKDRHKYAQNIFNKLNIPARFYIVKKHSKGGMYGCFESHINVIKEAYNNGKNNILIFEDDILPTKSYNLENIQNAINFMKFNNSWEIFFLGYSIVNNLPDNIHFFKPLLNNLYLNAYYVGKNIIQYKPYNTHSYCLNRKGMKKILNNYNKYIGIIHIDVYLSDYLNLNSYCYVPLLFDQKWCIGSDNINNKDNIFEMMCRKILCFYEKNELFWYISLIKYFLYYINIYSWVLVIIYIIIFISIIYLSNYYY